MKLKQEHEPEVTMPVVEAPYKVVYTVCGTKGTGKTTFSFRFKGAKRVISYDHKAERIKEYLYPSDTDIEIVDGTSGYERTPELMTVTASAAYQAISEAIKREPQPDWIIHDGLQTLHEICEMCMRGEYKIKPFDGVRERSVWKYRRVLLSYIHKLSLDSSRKGVIYNTYVGYEDVEVQDSEVITRRQAPKWFDIIEEETDTLFLTSIKDTKEESRFLVKVVTSKVPKWKTGEVRDVTLHTD